MHVVNFADATTVSACDSDINNVHATDFLCLNVNIFLFPNKLSLNDSKTSNIIISNQKDTFDNITIRDSILMKVSSQIS